MRRIALCLALVSLAFVPLVASPPTVAAAGCIRFVASQFNAPGDDHYNLNEEWVRIKNFCASGKSIGRWRIHDRDRGHCCYNFSSDVRIGAGKSITLFSGKGDDTRAKKYWDRVGAVWNNEPPERAVLRKDDGTLVSTWTEY